MDLLRLPTVMERTGIPRSTLFYMMKRNTFPQPVRISPRIIAWPAFAIDEWIEGQVRQAGYTIPEVKL